MYIWLYALVMPKLVMIFGISHHSNQLSPPVTENWHCTILITILFTILITWQLWAVHIPILLILNTLRSTKPWFLVGTFHINGSILGVCVVWTGDGILPTTTDRFPCHDWSEERLAPLSPRPGYGLRHWVDAQLPVPWVAMGNHGEMLDLLVGTWRNAGFYWRKMVIQWFFCWGGWWENDDDDDAGFLTCSKAFLSLKLDDIIILYFYYFLLPFWL